MAEIIEIRQVNKDVKKFVITVKTKDRKIAEKTCIKEMKNRGYIVDFLHCRPQVQEFNVCDVQVHVEKSS
jgi:hypothetical protein